MRGDTILRWMSEQDRTLGYVSTRSGIDPHRLIDLITGAVHPTDDEVAALARATMLSVEDLQRAIDTRDEAETHEEEVCYTVAQVARLLHVSTDVVRAEIKAGTLGCVIIGAKLQRIPAEALAERLSRWRDHATGPPDRRVAPAQSTPPGSSASHDDARASDQQHPLL